MKTTWTYGDKVRLARIAKCNPTQLNDIMAGRKQCRPELAIRLEKAATQLGYEIPRTVWCFPDLRKGSTLFPKCQ